MVAYSGPPLVMASGSAKRLVVHIVVRIRLRAANGRMSGQMIQRKTCHRLAPSTVAASYTSGLMVISAAPIISMVNGTPNQMFVRTRAQIAPVCALSQLTAGRPSAIRPSLITPFG